MMSINSFRLLVLVISALYVFACYAQGSENLHISVSGDILPSVNCAPISQSTTIVDFGYVNQSSIMSGVVKEIPFHIRCDDGIVIPQIMGMSVIAQIATFGTNNSVIATENLNNIGVQLLLNSEPLRINEKYTINAKVPGILEAKLVYNDSGTNEFGQILASATLTLDYQ